MIAAMAVQVPSYTFAAEAEEDKPQTAKEKAEARKKALQESEENVITIGGYRASEVNAINMKKFADTISANLSADDIGILPDQSIAESLQRLTGVTGNQTDGRSESVNVRGLGGDYTLTTLNGRESVSPWGSRSVNLSLFPGEVIRKAQVFKTAMSDSLEGGIGGTINMETIRPLTLKEDIKSISVNINGNTNFDNVNVGDTYGKKLSGLFTHHVSDELAVAVGAAVSKEPKLLESYKQNAFQPWINYDDAIDNELGPGSHQFKTRHDDIERTSVFATAQWQATPDLLITADYLDSHYEFEQFHSNTNFILWNNWQYEPGSVSMVDSGNTNNEPNVVAAAGTITGLTNAPVHVLNDDATKVYGINFSYDIDENTILDVDVSGSRSDRTYAWRGAWDNFAHGMDTHISWDTRGNTPQFTYYGTDVNGDGNLVNILGDGQYHEFTAVGATNGDVISENKAIRADLTFNTDFDFFHQIKVGVRKSRNEKEEVINNQQVGADQMPGVNHMDYQQLIMDQGYNTFSGVHGIDAPYFFNIRDMFADFDIPAPVQDHLDKAASYDLVEDTLALYVQTSFATDWMDGTIGLRYYNTELEANGNSTDLIIKKLGWQNQGKDVYKMFWPDIPTVTPVQGTNEYSDILPTLNVNFRMIDDVVIRLGVGKSMIRPTISKLTNALRIKNSIGNGKAFGAAWDAEDGDSSLGSIGNPELSPITSTQADISFEYYPNPSDFYALAVFYKDIDGLYISGAKHVAVEGAIDDDGNQVSLPLDTPIMGDGGSVSGTEFSFRKNLGVISDYLDGLSISGNYMKFNDGAKQDYNVRGGNPWNPNDTRYQQTLYRPAGWIESTWNMTLTWDITKDLSLRYNVNQQSEMAIGDYREYRVRLPARMHAMSLRYGRWDDFVIFGQVGNLTDQYTRDGQIFSKFSDVPQLDMIHEVQYQGLSYYIGASYRF